MFAKREPFRTGGADPAGGDEHLCREAQSEPVGADLGRDVFTASASK